MKLLEKMGWRPGQVLGKRGEGNIEPIALNVKMDRKGLISCEESGKGGKGGGKKVATSNATQGEYTIMVSIFCKKVKVRVILLIVSNNKSRRMTRLKKRNTVVSLLFK